MKIFGKKMKVGAHKTLIFFRKLRLFSEIQLIEINSEEFVSFLIVLEPACKIWKSLKNGNLVYQLAISCSFQTGAFPRIRDLKLIFVQNFHKNPNNNFAIWYNTVLSIIWDLVVHNWLRIEWENKICKMLQEKMKSRKEQGWWLLGCCFSRTKNSYKNLKI